MRRTRRICRWQRQRTALSGRRRAASLPFISVCARYLSSMARVWQCLIVAAFAAASCGPQAAPVSDFTGERYQMVQEQVKARGVSDQRVLAAMKKVRRDEFVPPNLKGSSYADQPLPIGYSQTISQPY